MAPSNEQEREAYHNIAAISQLAGTTHMTTGVTSSELPCKWKMMLSQKLLVFLLWDHLFHKWGLLHD